MSWLRKDIVYYLTMICCLIKDANDRDLFKIKMKGNFCSKSIGGRANCILVTQVDNESKGSKLLRAYSDKAAQVDNKISIEATYLEKTYPTIDRSPKSFMSNDIKQATNDDSLVDTNSSKKPDFSIDQSKSSEESVQNDGAIPMIFGHSGSNLISSILCHYYTQGFRGRGENCPFTHVQRKICSITFSNPQPTLFTR